MFCFHSCHGLLSASFGPPAPCNQSPRFTCMLHIYSSILFSPCGNVLFVHAKPFLTSLFCQASPCLFAKLVHASICHLHPAVSFLFVLSKIWLLTVVEFSY
ncbi:hypothetical protein XENORESO_002553 [Xenotaenia resolanae]|uniref:Uncharacterized protein n=1 Tax=Xenotaenia resolanae TaxID=208358 RepID=A0ABV0WI23_9TELE